jgi:hypothetical protein
MGEVLAEAPKSLQGVAAMEPTERSESQNKELAELSESLQSASDYDPLVDPLIQTSTVAEAVAAEMKVNDGESPTLDGMRAHLKGEALPEDEEPPAEDGDQTGGVQQSQ